MKRFLFGLGSLVALALVSQAQAQAPVRGQYQPLPEHGPEWLVGPAQALPGIWANTRPVTSRNNAYLTPAVCGRIYWGDWGGRTCGHGVALLLGDISARAQLCGQPEAQTIALQDLASSAAYSFGGTSSYDVAYTIDTFMSQFRKIKFYLRGNPALWLDCAAVAKQTERIAEFLTSYLPSNLDRLQNLPPVLQEQQLPQDGGNGQPTLWKQQTQTLFRQNVPQAALEARKAMQQKVDEAAVGHLSAALRASRTPLPYDQASLQIQYEYIKQSEGQTRGPRRITVQLAPTDPHIAIVSGQSWTELLVPLKGGSQGGLNVVVALTWQGGNDACLVQVNGFGVIDCEQFLTDAAMPAFTAAVQKADAR